jgi:hypothetical protein
MSLGAEPSEGSETVTVCYVGLRRTMPGRGEQTVNDVSVPERTPWVGSPPPKRPAQNSARLALWCCDSATERPAE